MWVCDILVVEKILDSNDGSIVQNSSVHNTVPTFSNNIPFCETARGEFHFLHAVPPTPPYVRILHRHLAAVGPATGNFALHHCCHRFNLDLHARLLLRITLHVTNLARRGRGEIRGLNHHDLLRHQRDAPGAVFRRQLPPLPAPAAPQAQEEDENQNHHREDDQNSHQHEKLQADTRGCAGLSHLCCLLTFP
ncbi:hypothetical protein V8G54_024443 [Vigna mungo]|uniref:Uncharacterized protein n=1 Tax=Vigna mungo TaxID=3915 RepID=A0AAQ3N6Z7_VIGMU